jgi:hypothetical protein
LLAVARVQAADDPMAIVDKAIKALGGADELGKKKAEQWKGRGTMVVNGLKMPYAAEYFFDQPNKFRLNSTMGLLGLSVNVSAGSDGENVWQKTADGAADVDKKKRESFLHNVYVLSLVHCLPLKEKELTLTLAEAIKVNGKPAVGLNVSNKGHADVPLWFDKQSGLPVKAESTLWDETTNADVKVECFLLDYRKKEGRMILNKLIIKRDGKDFVEEQLSDQKPLEKLDAKIFAKP